MDGAEADIAGWSAEILGSGDYVVLDPARRLRAGATPDPRLDAQCRGADGVRFDIAVPDFSTLSRRSKGLALPSTKSRATTSGPVHLVVDSTGCRQKTSGWRSIIRLKEPSERRAAAERA
ncbi:transposase (plasmid) [Sinorhizobium medicae]|uniref:transposase n=1 Tax=Sinorhizobium medicae TaxID=110321 RepID=UPI002AF6A870|nr:transposase [Sinorhizobium medicae]WQO68862.1 transposase [Sinorhizobium medicae]WQO95083.1 transposase [Sinorhizobium medicae]